MRALNNERASISITQAPVPVGEQAEAAPRPIIVGIDWDDLLGGATAHPTDPHTKIYALPHSELWFRRPDATLPAPCDGEEFCVKFYSEGSAVTGGCGRCIEAQGAPVMAGAGIDHVLWRLPKHMLVRKLALLIGLPITKELVFRPPLDLTARYFDTLSPLLGCVIGKIALSGGKPNPFVIAELEQAMLVALLCQGNHNMRETLDGVSPRPIPWQVRRAEEYIAEHWREPLDIEQVAQLTGSSVRTLFRLFRQFRGYTPGEFCRQQRMLHARDMLTDRASAPSIAAVARACGFSDLSNFSKEFVRVFGTRPSTLRRQKPEAA